MSRPIRHLRSLAHPVSLVSERERLGPKLRFRNRHAPKRRPFAKAGTPRRTERIRFFDVKHIKAELTIDTRKREVRGVVTHSLSPAASVSHAGRARLRSQAQGEQGDRRRQVEPLQVHHQGRQAVGHAR